MNIYKTEGRQYMPLIKSYSAITNKGLPQTIEKYVSPDGKNFVKVLKTNLGDTISKRVIAYKSNGPLEPKATKVIDKVYGGKDLYTPAADGTWRDKSGAIVPKMDNRTVAWG